MLIKDNRLSVQEDYHIKVLDLIRIGGTDVYMVIPAGMFGEGVHMISTETGELYDHDTFNHPIHLHNHLFKHYGAYELIKSKDLEINLNGPVRKLEKERKFR
jgi:hypothetical protein